MSDLKKILHKALTTNNFNLSPEIENQFLEYLELLQKWNRVYNLTAIRDPNEMVTLHILDSLSVNPYLQGNRIADIGTGAGLPGIPLALLNPDKHFVLVDSNSKKTRFLTHVVQTLKLSNIEVLHTRCEDFLPEKCFDTIVSRAFAAIEVMLTTTQHLLCPDGQFLAMKGVYPEQEIAEMPAGFEVLRAPKLIIKGLDAERHVVCIGIHKGK